MLSILGCQLKFTPKIYEYKVSEEGVIMLKSYFQDLFNTTKAGNVREESYYPALKKLLKETMLNDADTRAKL